MLLAEVPLALARHWGAWNLQSHETSRLTSVTLWEFNVVIENHHF